MRTIEVIFWGFALFVPQDDGYRVSLPDGRNAAKVKVPVHHAKVDMRPKAAKTTVHSWGDWPHDAPNATENTFTIHEPCEITLEGLIDEPLLVQFNFNHRLPNTKKADKYFKKKTDPEVIAELTIKSGELTAHQWPDQMVATKWTVHAEDSSDVTLKCSNKSGTRAIRLPSATTQVLLTNFARRATDKENHFPMYRLISGNYTKALDAPGPQRDPLAKIEIKDGDPIPTDDGSDEEEEKRSRPDTDHTHAKAFSTPFIDCSNASMVEPLPAPAGVAKQKKKPQ